MTHTSRKGIFTNRLTMEVERRRWKTYSNKKVSYQIEESLFNEMMALLHKIPPHVGMVVLPDAAFSQLYELIGRFLKDEIKPMLQATHARGYEVAMLESHIAKPFRITIHYLSDGETVYITRKEMLPYT